MTLNQKISDDLKNSIKSKDKARTSCLRMLKTGMKNLQVSKGRELEEDEIHTLISSMVRKAKEAAEEFRKGNREDLAQKEEFEVKILQEYLPQQLALHEIEGILKETISEVSAEGMKDLGKVMKIAMGKMAGRAQGKEVNEIARKLLS